MQAAKDGSPYMKPARADQIRPLDMFKIGVGPSSSHTVGPMLAALKFRSRLAAQPVAGSGLRLQVELFGSLSLTGRGHSTDAAVCAGLAGLHPRTAEPDAIWAVKPHLIDKPWIGIDAARIDFNPATDILWRQWTLDNRPITHPNTMRLQLRSASETLCEETWISVGGGFVEKVEGESAPVPIPAPGRTEPTVIPYSYATAAEFVGQCVRHNLRPWEVVIANEAACGIGEKQLRQELSEILDVMESCMERGLAAEGILPGGLNVRRRARELYQKIGSGQVPPWAVAHLRPSAYAMAVNEENAAGGRVVTAPTNGSSGLIPAVWRTLREAQNLSRETLENGLMTASVIGALVKTLASISGAEIGCQGEVGASCAMAAGGAAVMLGGTPSQMEQAAEIAIEHHLGMTCDPMMGLVQVPCIERNAVGAVKALDAVALSLVSDRKHLVSLDRALAVMKATGVDMNQKYKETSTGGLAMG
jgi:L-serine dehydratase